MDVSGFKRAVTGRLQELREAVEKALVSPTQEASKMSELTSLEMLFEGTEEAFPSDDILNDEEGALGKSSLQGTSLFSRIQASICPHLDSDVRYLSKAFYSEDN